MKAKLALIYHVALLLLLAILNFQPLPVFAQGTTFTYQGSLNDNGSPANGTNYGMVFYLYDAPANGTVLGNLGIVSVSVSNGLFTVPLDFGTNFPGADRWLEITVQKNGGSFTTLAPRQKLNPTPYAITAANLSGSLPAGQLTGTIPASSIAGPYTSAVTLNNPANNFTGAFTGNGAGLTNIPTSGSAWQLTGNAGTTAGVNFLGTTDNQPLELDVNAGRAFRLEPTVNDTNHSGIVNVVGGSPANFVAPGTYGATISGGGGVDYTGFNAANTVASDFGTVGGGAVNAILTDSSFSTIGGGSHNTIQTNASYSSIVGGQQNAIQSLSPYSTIGGGLINTIQTNNYGTVIAGGGMNAIFNSVSYAVIGGGSFNQIAPNANNSLIAGGKFNLIQASASYDAIGGGQDNIIQAMANASTIGGGQGNVIVGGFFNGSPVFSQSATIGGGENNEILTNATGATIAGGIFNIIQGGVSVSGPFIFPSTISGGARNTIQINASGSTIGGGGANTIQGGDTIFGLSLVSATYATIGGGQNNVIQTNANGSTISGGQNNTIQAGLPSSSPFSGPSKAVNSTIGGGYQNTIQTNSGYSTIAGGSNNVAAGNFATIPGGDQNVAETNSFAAGHRAKATNTGTFVWADSTDVDFASTADNQFLIRASGGVGIGANNPDAMLTVNGTADKPGGGAWTVFSDARLKKNIEPLTGALNRLLELRAVTFEYKDPQSIHELPGVQIGMIAQEVEKVFPDWVDTAPNGMKRLSIHGFEALTVESFRELRAEKDAKISDLEKQLAAQKEVNSQTAARFDALEKAVARLAGQSTAALAVNHDAAK